VTVQVQVPRGAVAPESVLPSQEARTAAAAAPVSVRTTVPEAPLSVRLQSAGLFSCRTGRHGDKVSGPPGCGSVWASTCASGEAGTPAVTIAT
jgi:hypothetical protein